MLGNTENVIRVFGSPLLAPIAAVFVWLSLLAWTLAFIGPARYVDLTSHPAWPATESRRSRSKAALMRARCVNAWGKLPRCCAWGPSSSPYNPR